MMICNKTVTYGRAVSAILNEFSPFNAYDELHMIFNPIYG